MVRHSDAMTDERPQQLTGASEFARALSRAVVLPVVELPSAECAAPLCEALLAGGGDVVEITLRSAAGLTALPQLRAAYPGMLIGAGTVRTCDDLRQAADAGARFIVSPATNPDLIEFGHSLGVPVIPGVCTPTDVDLATRSGARTVKFFPAAAMGGVAALKALAGPFPEVQFVPTGGIGPTNLASYLELPNVLACGGSWLVARHLLAAHRFDQVAALTREALDIVAQVRQRAAGT